MLLSVDNLHVFYGQSHILQGVTLSVDEGEMVCVLGRNGVGKTTLLRGLMRLTPPRSGTVSFDGTDLARLAPHQIANQGIAYVPQGRHIFPDLTVEENLQLGAVTKPGDNKEPDTSVVFQVFPVLKERLRQRGGTLSGGEQQMLALARGLVAEPRLMLLDEPSEGLAPGLLQDMVVALRDINRTLGLSVLLVEQNLDVAFELAHRGYIMEKGRMVLEGAVETLRDDELIRQHLAL
jgi:urea ABC transporter ATP-binding protein UrtE